MVRKLLIRSIASAIAITTLGCFPAEAKRFTIGTCTRIGATRAADGVTYKCRAEAGSAKKNWLPLKIGPQPGDFMDPTKAPTDKKKGFFGLTRMTVSAPTGVDQDTLLLVAGLACQYYVAATFLDLNNLALQKRVATQIWDATSKIGFDYEMAFIVAYTAAHYFCPKTAAFAGWLPDTG